MDGLLRTSQEPVRVIVFDPQFTNDLIEEDQDLQKLITLFNQHLLDVLHVDCLYKKLEGSKSTLIVKETQKKQSIPKKNLSLVEIEDEAVLIHNCMRKIWSSFASAFVLQTTTVKKAKDKLNQLKIWIKTLPKRLYCVSFDGIILSESVPLSCSKHV